VRVGATVSIVTHAALVLSLALGTQQAAVRSEGAQESIIETAIRFLLPPDKRMVASDEVTARWSSQRAGSLQPTSSAAKDGSPAPKETGADANRDVQGSAPVSLAEAADAQDAYTFLDVDSVALRDPESAGPAYPALLMAQGIEGGAVVRFVVDTTGRADVETFQLIETNHRLFAAAVRAALPGMKFRPARIGALKVRQLVEQPFLFRIVRPGTPPPVKNP
jgi:TonB family protein